MNKPDKKTMKKRATAGRAASARVQPVAAVVMIEHRACGTSFPKDEPCPKCHKQLLEG